MVLKKLQLGLVISLCAIFVHGQKNELEYRIDPDAFPAEAMEQVIDKIADSDKVRYYKEIDIDKISYELKIKRDGRRYSIEFDSIGNLEDVEIQIDEDGIPQKTFERIKDYYQNFYDRYRIIKVQKHYAADVFGKKTLNYGFYNHDDADVRFEIVAAGKRNKSYERYEMLFNMEGNVLRKRKFITPNYDHILY